MDEITNILQEIERVRSKLVEYTIQAGDFIEEGVLHLSCKLDDLITAYYSLMLNNKSSDLQIA
jgi:hypothetical protein